MSLPFFQIRSSIAMLKFIWALFHSALMFIVVMKIISPVFSWCFDLHTRDEVQFVSWCFDLHSRDEDHLAGFFMML